MNATAYSRQHATDTAVEAARAENARLRKDSARWSAWANAIAEASKTGQESRFLKSIMDAAGHGRKFTRAELETWTDLAMTHEAHCATKESFP